MILKKEKAQELCETESQGGYLGLPVPYNNNNNNNTLIVLMVMVSVDAKQHLKKKIRSLDVWMC